jgi:hypothetical protein
MPSLSSFETTLPDTDILQPETDSQRHLMSWRQGMQRELTSPAIVKADVSSLVSEIKAAIAELETHMQRGAELAFKLGTLCIRLKETVGHGQWGSVVRLHLGKSERQVQRWMRLANTTHASDLDEQWRIISGHDGESDDESEDGESEEDDGTVNQKHPRRKGTLAKKKCKLVLCSRCSRFVAEGGRPITNCPQCAELKNGDDNRSRNDTSLDPWKQFERHFRPLAEALDLVHEWPSAKETILAIRKALDVVCEEWEKLKKIDQRESAR